MVFNRDKKDHSRYLNERVATWLLIADTFLRPERKGRICYIEILSLLELDLSLFSHFARTLPLCILSAAVKLCENWTSLFAVLTIVHKVGQKSWCQKNYTNIKVSLCEKKE